MSPRRSQTDEPRPEEEAAGQEPDEAREQQEPETEPPDEVTPLVEGAPVSAAARHNARYGTP